VWKALNLADSTAGLSDDYWAAKRAASKDWKLVDKKDGSKAVLKVVSKDFYWAVHLAVL
jgi:hypothetical protein